MKYKTFEFSTQNGDSSKYLRVTLPTEHNGVVTNKYCPPLLLTGGIGFIPAINGESETEFIYDCRKQISAMEAVGQEFSQMERHLAGLMTIVMNHILCCGRMIFGDLLIYMDVFSLLLEADGVDEEEIKNAYPQILRQIIELNPERILNTFDLSPFKGSHFDLMLSIASCKKENLLAQ